MFLDKLGPKGYPGGVLLGWVDVFWSTMLCNWVILLTASNHANMLKFALVTKFTFSKIERSAGLIPIALSRIIVHFDVDDTLGLDEDGWVTSWRTWRKASDK